MDITTKLIQDIEELERTLAKFCESYCIDRALFNHSLQQKLETLSWRIQTLERCWTRSLNNKCEIFREGFVDNEDNIIALNEDNLPTPDNSLTPDNSPSPDNSPAPENLQKDFPHTSLTLLKKITEINALNEFAIIRDLSTEYKCLLCKGNSAFRTEYLVVQHCNAKIHTFHMSSIYSLETLKAFNKIWDHNFNIDKINKYATEPFTPTRIRCQTCKLAIDIDEYNLHQHFTSSDHTTSSSFMKLLDMYNVWKRDHTTLYKENGSKLNNLTSIQTDEDQILVSTSPATEFKIDNHINATENSDSNLSVNSLLKTKYPEFILKQMSQSHMEHAVNEILKEKYECNELNTVDNNEQIETANKFKDNPCTTAVGNVSDVVICSKKEHFIKIDKSNCFCTVCLTALNINNVPSHISGRKHKSTLQLKYSVEQKNYYCLLCKELFPSCDVFKKHVNSSEHQQKELIVLTSDANITELFEKQCSICSIWLYGDSKSISEHDHYIPNEAPTSSAASSIQPPDSTTPQNKTQLPKSSIDGMNKLHKYNSLAIFPGVKIDNCLICRITIPKGIKNTLAHLNGARHKKEMCQKDKLALLEPFWKLCDSIENTSNRQFQLNKYLIFPESSNSVYCKACDAAVRTDNWPNFMKHFEKNAHIHSKAYSVMKTFFKKDDWKNQADTNGTPTASSNSKNISKSNANSASATNQTNILSDKSTKKTKTILELPKPKVSSEISNGMNKPIKTNNTKITEPCITVPCTSQTPKHKDKSKIAVNKNNDTSSPTIKKAKTKLTISLQEKTEPLVLQNIMHLEDLSSYKKDADLETADWTDKIGIDLTKKNIEIAPKTNKNDYQLNTSYLAAHKAWFDVNDCDTFNKLFFLSEEKSYMCILCNEEIDIIENNRSVCDHINTAKHKASLKKVTLSHRYYCHPCNFLIYDKPWYEMHKGSPWHKNRLVVLCDILGETVFTEVVCRECGVVTFGDLSVLPPHAHATFELATGEKYELHCSDDVNFSRKYDALCIHAPKNCIGEIFSDNLEMQIEDGAIEYEYIGNPLDYERGAILSELRCAEEGIPDDKHSLYHIGMKVVSQRPCKSQYEKVYNKISKQPKPSNRAGEAKMMAQEAKQARNKLKSLQKKLLDAINKVNSKAADALETTENDKMLLSKAKVEENAFLSISEKDISPNESIKLEVNNPDTAVDNTASELTTENQIDGSQEPDSQSCNGSDNCAVEENACSSSQSQILSDITIQSKTNSTSSTNSVSDTSNDPASVSGSELDIKSSIEEITSNSDDENIEENNTCSSTSKPELPYNSGEPSAETHNVEMIPLANGEYGSFSLEKICNLSEFRKLWDYIYSYMSAQQVLRRTDLSEAQKQEMVKDYRDIAEIAGPEIFALVENALKNHMNEEKSKTDQNEISAESSSSTGTSDVKLKESVSTTPQIIQSAAQQETRSEFELLWVNCEKDALVHKNLFGTTNNKLLCKLCNVNISLHKKPLFEHIRGRAHSENVDINLTVRYHCEICSTVVSKSNNFDEHTSSKNHKIRLNKLPAENMIQSKCAVCRVITLRPRNSVLQHMHFPFIFTPQTQPPQTSVPKNKSKKLNIRNITALLRDERHLCQLSVKLVKAALSIMRNNSSDLLTCRALESDLGDVFPGCRAYMFGSRVSGLASLDSDLDVYLDTGGMYDGSKLQDCDSQEELVNQCFSALRQTRRWSHLCPITRARTPILQAFHTKYGVDCDISFRHGLSVENTALLSVLLCDQPIARRLILTVKEWIKATRLSLGGYTLSFLVIFYLQTKKILPAIYDIMNNGNDDHQPKKIICDWECQLRDFKPSTKTTEKFVPLLRGFFEYYAKTFDYENLVVCPLMGVPVLKFDFSKPELLPVQLKQYTRHFRQIPPGALSDPNSYVSKWVMDHPSKEMFRNESAFCVQDPFDLSHNLTKALSKIDLEKFIEYCKHSADVVGTGVCRTFVDNFDDVSETNSVLSKLK